MEDINLLNSEEHEEEEELICNDHVNIANDYIIDLFVRCVTKYNNDLTTHAEYKGKYNPDTTNPSLDIQLFYDNDTNKCYMELRLNSIFKQVYSEYLSNIKTTFDNAISSKFKQDTGMYREMIMPEDGKHEFSDSSAIVTPFTIGYWKSLSGRYEFLEDETKIYKAYNDAYFPTYPDEYNARKEEIYTEYYKSDFNTFVRKMYELNTEFNIDYDYKPSRKFEEFIDIVEDINNAYKQVVLSEEEYQNYTDMYMDIHTLYKDDPEELKLMIDNLNDSYGVIAELQKKVPEIFNVYKEYYKDFFGKELTYIDIREYDAPDSYGEYETEIWRYEGDFDLGSLEEGVDPDSVAKEDYDYNIATDYYRISLSSYDIIVDTEEE